MDIVLDTVFGNPNLPVVPIPGFRDDFDRPAAASLGATTDGKPWTYSGTPWRLTGNGTATSDPDGSLWAAVDALTPNGTVTGVVAKAPSEGSDSRFGLALRAVDNANYIWLTNNTADVLTLYVTVDGATDSTTTITGQSLTDGSVITAVLDGPSITVLHNGVQVHQQNVTQHATAQLFGFYARSSTDAEWESIEMTAAL